MGVSGCLCCKHGLAAFEKLRRAFAQVIQKADVAQGNGQIQQQNAVKQREQHDAHQRGGNHKHGVHDGFGVLPQAGVDGVKAVNQTLVGHGCSFVYVGWDGVLRQECL